MCAPYKALGFPCLRPTFFIREHRQMPQNARVCRSIEFQTLSSMTRSLL